MSHSTTFLMTVKQKRGEIANEEQKINGNEKH